MGERRENDDFRACGKAACIRPHDFQMSAKAGRERPDTKNSQTNDRRNTYVCLTPKGNEIYNEAFRTLSSFVEQALSRIDEEELDQFFITFDKIYDALVIEYNSLGKEDEDVPPVSPD